MSSKGFSRRLECGMQGLKVVVDRGMHSNTLVKLSHLLVARAHSQQNHRIGEKPEKVQKENGGQLKNRESCKLIEQNKSKRVMSQKLQRGESKKEEKRLFLDLLNLPNDSKKEKQGIFRPYYLQQSCKKQSQTDYYPRNRKQELKITNFIGMSNKKYENEVWKVQKWQTPQQPESYSILMMDQTE